MRFSDLSDEDVAAILDHMDTKGLTDWDVGETVHVKMLPIDPNRLSPGLDYY